MQPNHYLSVLIDYLFQQPAAVERQGGDRQDGGQHRA
jgi:phosphoglucomutase